MSRAEQCVRATVDAWLDAISQLDFAAARELWDAESDGHLLYQPEELERPMTTIAELVDYWAWVPGPIESVPEWRAIETNVQFDGVVPCTLGLRDGADGWRLVHHHESRLVSVEEAQSSLAGAGA
jgi:hypothetical protein